MGRVKVLSDYGLHCSIEPRRHYTSIFGKPIMSTVCPNVGLKRLYEIKHDPSEELGARQS